MMRQSAKRYVVASLIDPGFAEFEWPFGFVEGYWKPPLQRRVVGQIACGTINAKNRFGGYVGRSAFVVVLDDNGNPLFRDMDSGSSGGLVNMQCGKFASNLPPPQEGMLDTEEPAKDPSGLASVAEELSKLADLRDRGVITAAEFDSQKAKLLGK